MIKMTIMKIYRDITSTITTPVTVSHPVGTDANDIYQAAVDAARQNIKSVEIDKAGEWIRHSTAGMEVLL